MTPATEIEHPHERWGITNHKTNSRRTKMKMTIWLSGTSETYERLESRRVIDTCAHPVDVYNREHLLFPPL
jgi:hypothetical protein